MGRYINPIFCIDAPSSTKIMNKNLPDFFSFIKKRNPNIKNAIHKKFRIWTISKKNGYIKYKVIKIDLFFTRPNKETLIMLSPSIEINNLK